MLHLHIKDTNGNGYIFTVWLLFTHCVERSKKKKNPHHSNICSWYWFDTDWNSWVGCLWYCDNREPSILFKYKLFYVWFAVLCVTRGALVPRKRAYTAWRKLTANYLEFSRYFMLATPTSLICFLLLCSSLWIYVSKWCLLMVLLLASQVALESINSWEALCYIQEQLRQMEEQEKGQWALRRLFRRFPV